MACLPVRGVEIESFRAQARRSPNYDNRDPTCAMVTVCVLFYVFYLPGKFQMGPEKTRLSYLRERKEAVYENLRDFNFDIRPESCPIRIISR